MKISVKELREMVNEALRGVPPFIFAEATRKYVDDVREQLRQHILVDKSSTMAVQREAFEAANKVLTEFEEQVNSLLEEKLYNFLQQT